MIAFHILSSPVIRRWNTVIKACAINKTLDGLKCFWIRVSFFFAVLFDNVVQFGRRPRLLQIPSAPRLLHTIFYVLWVASCILHFLIQRRFVIPISIVVYYVVAHFLACTSLSSISDSLSSSKPSILCAIPVFLLGDFPPPIVCKYIYVVLFAFLHFFLHPFPRYFYTYYDVP